MRLNGITGYDVTEAWADSLVTDSVPIYSSIFPPSNFVAENSLGDNLETSASLVHPCYIAWTFSARKEREDYDPTQPPVEIEALIIHVGANKDQEIVLPLPKAASPTPTWLKK